MENELTKIVVIIEGVVSEENWGTLKEFHEGSKFLPEGLQSSVLVQNKENPFMWKMINTWDSLSAFEKGQTLNNKPSGGHLFEAVDAKALANSFYEIRSYIDKTTQAAKA